ncbi:MAG: PD-(D/E)XK nuclease family protein [Spirochaetaceae bacterium]|nr:MAG: PD-(D/E)XK nuclease family protein [Spirochaetaceae bacterium]
MSTDTLNDAFLDALEHDRICVFPSEVTAAFSRRRAIELDSRRAIRSDSVVSWDTFKEHLFGGRRDDRPVNSVLRRAFAAQFLERNAADRLVTTIVPPAYAETSSPYAPYIVSFLPNLAALVSSSGLARLDAAFVADLRTLHLSYDEFLRDRGLFEPSWTEPLMRSSSLRYTIFYPEIVTDYPEFARHIETLKTVNVVHAPKADPAGEATPARLHRYASLPEEVTSVIGTIARLLDSGVPADEIAITYGGDESIQEYIERTAALYDVPLSPRRGRELSSYGGAGVFDLIASVVESGFGVEALEPLLVNRSIPWKNPSLCRRLVRYGIEHACIVRTTGEAAVDTWRDAFSVGDPDRIGSLERFFGAILTYLTRIARAPSAADLRRRVNDFLRSLDVDGWSRTDERALQSALTVLEELVDAETVLGAPVPSPWALFRELVSERRYVPGTPPPGVTVYPYRVSAGIVPEYHFVVNASHAATAVRVTPFGLLREDYQSALGAEPRDLSGDFLEMYALSGSVVRFSYALIGLDGAQLPAAGFVATRSVVPVEHTEHDTTYDPFAAELATFSGTGPLPPSLTPVQARGIERIAATGLSPTPARFTVAAITAPSSLDRIASALVPRHAADGAPRETPGTIFTSPTDLETFTTCRFAYLIARVAGLHELAFAVDPEPALGLGSLYHKIAEDLFTAIGAEDGRFRADHIERYREIAAQTISRLTDDGRCAAYGIPRPVFDCISSVVADAIDRLITAEAETFAEYAPVKEEGWSSAVFDSDMVRLVGRIDRVSRAPDGDEYLVVDYKKGGVPHKKSIPGTLQHDPDKGVSLQIPAYIALLDAHGTRVTDAAYYSFRKGAFEFVVSDAPNKPWADRSETDRILESFRATVSEFAKTVRAGDFTAPDGGCDACRFRGVCRTKFVVRS